MRMSGTSLPPQNRPARIVSELAKPVFFVGFMGAGKTSVARKLARTCGIGPAARVLRGRGCAGS